MTGRQKVQLFREYLVAWNTYVGIPEHRKRENPRLRETAEKALGVTVRVGSILEEAYGEDWKHQYQTWKTREGR